MLLLYATHGLVAGVWTYMFLASLCSPGLGWVCSRARKMFCGFSLLATPACNNRCMLLPSLGAGSSREIFTMFIAMW